MIVPNVVDNLL